MRSATLVCSLLSLSVVYASPHSHVTPQSVREAFIESGLVPEVLPSFNPEFLLDVTYTIPGYGYKKEVAPPGRNFTMPQTLNKPTFSIRSFDRQLASEKFVVAMLDPDAPTPQNPFVSQIRHFIGGNFRLQHSRSDLGAGAVLVNTTPALSDYLQPAPPNTSDPHRYTWLLFRQPLNFPMTVSPNITNFNISAFAQQFGLGPALAGNFMTVSTNPVDLAAVGEA